MYKISTNIQPFAKRVGEEKAIRMLAKAGFDCYDFSMLSMAHIDRQTKTIMPSDHPLQSDHWREFCQNLRRAADECGIKCNQSHAPFPTGAEWIFPYLERSIEATAIVGGKICVIHPDNNKSAEENATFYRRLLPTAHKFGVKIATENMWNWDREKKQALPAACSNEDDFLAHVEAVNDEYLVACVDVGHAEMRGLNTNAYNMIKKLGRHVATLHLHDNDLHRDKHATPFTMQIDFDAVARALAEIDYQGDMTLEISFDGVEDDELACILDKMAAAARKLGEMTDAYKAKLKK